MIPELDRSSGEGDGYPLQYSCLGNPWTEEHLLLFVGVLNMLNALGALLILNTQNSMTYIPLLCQFGDKENVHTGLTLSYSFPFVPTLSPKT